MSQQAISPESGPTLPPLSYKDTAVLTTELLAIAYEVEEHQIRQNFKNNKDRFIEGKHYFSVTGEELAAFRLCVENFYPQISPKARTLTLWTERGAARHAKMLNSDKAWDVFELLEETFFAVTKPAKVKSEQVGPDTPIGPADQNILQTIVRTKALALADASHKGGFPQIWSRFNNHFRLGSYKQLPQSKMAEAVAYLVKLEVREKKKELPQTSAVLEQYSDKAQAALENVKDKSAQFMYALFDLQKTIDEKAAHKEAIPIAARQMSASVRQMATSLGVSLSALTDLVEMYCGSLAPRAEQLPQFPSAVVTNIPGPRPGDKYYAYLEKVEKWRVATVAERKNLYHEGIALLDPGRMGSEMFYVCADYLSLWLKEGVLSSDTSVFDELLRHNRAPVMLAKFLNTNFESVEKYLK